MARSRTCDVCGKPTDRIVMKLFIAPVSENTRQTHAAYTGHADVGQCCSERMLSTVHWQKRRKVPRKVKAA